MRKPLLAANWKMNLTRREAVNMVKELLDLCGDLVAEQKDREVLICPPFYLLGDIKALLVDRFGFYLGAQNMHWASSGAYTGEISPLMLRDIGCAYVIIGHSERRAMFGETDETCAKKVLAAWEYGLIPVLCVGETLEQRKSGKTEEVVVGQLREALKGSTLDSGSRLVVAYEPVWAIGTGQTATPDDAQSTMALLRAELSNMYSERVARDIRILYGGSVKPTNIDALMAKPDIDGALVGGASLKAESFSRIVSFQVGAPA